MNRFSWRKKILLVLTILALAALIAGCNKSNTKSSETGKEVTTISLRFAAAEPGGAWYPFAVAVGETIKSNVPGATVSVEPGGAIANCISVAQGKAFLGLTGAMSMADAIAGRNPFKEALPDLRFVVNLFPHYIQWMVREDSGINSVLDLKGKTVSVGPKGLAANQVAEFIFDLYGIKKEEINVRYQGFNDSAEAYKDGHIQGILVIGMLPLGYLSDPAMVKPSKLLSFDEDILDKLITKHQGFVKVVMKGETIPYKKNHPDIKSAYIPTIIAVRKDAPEDLVYKITKAIGENIKGMEATAPQMKGVDPKNLCINTGLPIHPGALKYFKEKGWM